MMRMGIAVIVGALGVLAPGVVSADNGVRPNQGGCPKASHWVRSDRAEWLEATRAGIESEGLTIEEAAALFGFDDVREFEAWLLDNVFGPNGIDDNGDGWLCRSTNNPGGSPDFYFLVADNKYNAKFG